MLHCSRRNACGDQQYHRFFSAFQRDPIYRSVFPHNVRGCGNLTNIDVSPWVCAWTSSCALTPTWDGLLAFRILAGINASSPISVSGGIYADIYKDPVTRGRAMAVFTAGTCGFISPVLGWRWTFWIGLIVAGVSCAPLVFLPETYGPILLLKRAQRL
ncbi:hypothetical protein BPOR_0630g00080 [Botrytis porri]|uniref:Major facilitator superfamily (MFS) profile domain-containing protein n=1 Tax=Botrytis porri TaxID=87229 RepID=A0A4Z1KQ25_9HELO|nr:hypothetical protein BPOR_0630g00080 [Botrytis porri]